MEERCPNDGQTWEWHSFNESTAGVYSQGRTNGEFIGCPWKPANLEKKETKNERNY